MNAISQLKLLTINNSGEVLTAGEEYFVVDGVSDQEHSEGQGALLVMPLQLFLILLQLNSLQYGSGSDRIQGSQPLRVSF